MYTGTSLWLSSDFGVTWTQTPTALDTTANQNPSESVAMSSDGTHIVLGGQQGPSGVNASIQWSADSGATWSVPSDMVQSDWSQAEITLSADGSKLFVVGARHLATYGPPKTAPFTLSAVTLGLYTDGSSTGGPTTISTVPQGRHTSRTYTVSPALPAGLVMDTSGGVATISATPGATLAETSYTAYTVTGTNSTGSYSKIFYLNVSALPAPLSCTVTNTSAILDTNSTVLSGDGAYLAEVSCTGGRTQV